MQGCIRALCKAHAYPLDSGGIFAYCRSHFFQHVARCSRCKEHTNNLLICKGLHSFFCESCVGDGEQCCDQCKHALMFGNIGAFSDLLPMQECVSLTLTFLFFFVLLMTHCDLHNLHFAIQCYIRMIWSKRILVRNIHLVM